MNDKLVFVFVVSSKTGGLLRWLQSYALRPSFFLCRMWTVRLVASVGLDRDFVM